MKKTILMLAATLLCGSALSAQTLLKQGELTNVRRLTSDTDIKYENPQWSPDGSRVAFTKMGYDCLYVINADGTQKRELSADAGVGYMMQWGADSKEILVRDTRWESTGSEMRRAHAAWSVNLEGKKTRLSEDAEYMLPASWRYDKNGNKSIVTDAAMQSASNKLQPISLDKIKKIEMNNNPFTVSFSTDCENLYRVDAKGNRTVIYTGEAFHPVLSPDGKRVVFVNLYDEIIVMNIDGTAQQIVAKGFSPSWIDNSNIIYERTTDDGHTYLTGDLYTTNLDNRVELQLTATPTRIEMNAAVSPDGKKIVFTDFYDGQLYIADFK